MWMLEYNIYVLLQFSCNSSKFLTDNKERSFSKTAKIVFIHLCYLFICLFVHSFIASMSLPAAWEVQDWICESFTSPDNLNRS